MTKTEKPRWQYRFDNYSRAFALLCEGMEALEKREVTQLEREGIVQRFEFTWELAWKVLKDYLEHSGVTLETVTPVSVIRAAIAAKLIDNAPVWMEALDARNKMSHTYDLKRFEQIVADIGSKYLKLLSALHSSFLARLPEG